MSSPEFTTYHSLPKFVNSSELQRDIEDGEDRNVAVNGWNTHLEEWLIDIQNDSNLYYCMLIETSKVVTWWKWIVMILYAILMLSIAIVSGLSIYTDGIALPITSIVLTALAGFCYIFMESIGFGDWASSCRDAAEDFIMLGRRIESQKRIPRAERLESGLKFSNAASMRFEELRAAVPSIPDRIMTRHKSRNPSTPTLKIPVKVLELASIHSQSTTTSNSGQSVVDHSEVDALGHDARGDLEEVIVDTFDSDTSLAAKEEAGVKQTDKGKEESVAIPVERDEQWTRKSKLGTLQNLFQERLAMAKQEREEQDALAQYENYVRERYAIASDESTVSQPQAPPGAIGRRKGSLAMRLTRK